MRSLLVFALGLALAAPALGQTMPEETPPEQTPPGRRIVVTGEGRVEAAPDLATVSAGVETEAASATDALTRNSAAMAQVLAALGEAGIAAADVQTSAIALEPVWNQPREGEAGAPRITGYAARNIVTIQVREIARLGGVLDALAQAGANRLAGIAFALSEPEARENEAREAAVADARARAEIYARAAGVGLGPVLEIRENPGYGGPGPLRSEAVMMDVPVAEGTVAVTRQVEMVFAIE